MARLTSRRGFRVGMLLAVLLAAGLVASLAGAWGVELVRAYRVSREGVPPYTGPMAFERYNISTGRGLFHAWVERSMGRTEWMVDFGAIAGELQGPLPCWVRLPPAEKGRGTVAVAYGIPFRCLKYDGDSLMTENGPGSYRVTTQFRNALTWTSADVAFHAQLPLVPIWIGLLANSAIFSGVFGMPWAVRILRRRARVGRGCCPFCGYDLRGGSAGPCPECGRTSGPPRP